LPAMVDRLNRSRRDKLDWAAKLGLGPLAGPGEAVSTGTGETPRSRETLVQRRQAEEMAELRRRIDQKQADVADKPPAKKEEEDLDDSGFLNPNAKSNPKKKVAPKSVLELRIGRTPVVVTSQPEPSRERMDENEPEEEDKDKEKERRAKQKAATRFQDVAEEPSPGSERKGRKRRGRVGYDEDSDERRRFRSRSGRYSEDPQGRGRGDRSRSSDGFFDDDDSSEVRRRKKKEEKRKREEWRKQWKKVQEARRRGARSSEEGSDCDLERRASAERSPVRKTKTTIGVPEAQVDHVGGVQRRYVGQLRDWELDERLRRAEQIHGLNSERKLLTEAEAIAMLQGGGSSKRRR